MKSRTIIWRNIRLDIPEDWEMLQYSKNDDVGNCSFGDRYMFRLELNWKIVPAAPDHERMIGDYISKLKDEGTLSKEKKFTHGHWQGFSAFQGDLWVTRVGRYFEAAGKLLELVFFWPSNVEQKTLKPILESLRFTEAEDGFQNWQAFGLNIKAADGLLLDSCDIQPAMAQMTFSNKKGAEHIENFERLGMVNTWLKGSLEEWLKAKEPDKLKDQVYQRKINRQHDIHFVSGKMTPMRFPRVLRKTNNYASAAWICPRDGRLYSACIMSPSDATSDQDLPGQRLCCCEDISS